MNPNYSINVLRHFIRQHVQPIVLCICGAAFICHFYASDFKGIWIDEAHRLAIANGGSFKGDLTHRHPGGPGAVLEASKGYPHQPAYYLLVNAIFRITHSYSTIIQYFTNTLLFVLSAIALFNIARMLLPPQGQLVALLLYAFSGQAIAFALQIREYCLILFLLTWNIFFFLALSRERSGIGRISFAALALGYIMTATLGVYASLWMFFFFWPQTLLTIWKARHGPRRILVVLASQAAAGFVLLPWLLHDLRAKLNTAVYDKTPPTLSYLVNRCLKGFEFVLTGNFVHPWMPRVFHLMFFLLGGTVVVYVVLSVMRFRKISFGWRYVVLCICSFFGFQLAYFFLKEPLSVNPRYFILYLPFTSLVLGGAFVYLQRSPQHTRRYDGLYELGGILVALSIGLLEICQYYHDPDVDHRDDFRTIYRYLDTFAARDADIVVDARVNLLSLQFYSNRPERILPLRHYQVSVSSTKEIWIVTNRPEPPVKSMVLALQARLIQAGYRLQMKHTIELTQLSQYIGQKDAGQPDAARKAPSQ
jgi:hypothetical protein